MPKLFPKKALINNREDLSFETLFKMYQENEVLAVNHTNDLKKYFMEDWLSVQVSFKNLDYRNHSTIKCQHLLVKVDHELICPFCLASTKNFNLSSEELAFLTMAATKRRIYLGEISKYDFSGLRQITENYLAGFLEDVKPRYYLKERLLLLSKINETDLVYNTIKGELKELTKKKTIN